MLRWFTLSFVALVVAVLPASRLVVAAAVAVGTLVFLWFAAYAAVPQSAVATDR